MIEIVNKHEEGVIHCLVLDIEVNGKPINVEVKKYVGDLDIENVIEIDELDEDSLTSSEIREIEDYFNDY